MSNVAVTAGPQRPDLEQEDLHPSLVDPVMTSMDFLNGIAERFPDAISFAAGRPVEDFFDYRDIARHVETFAQHLRQERGLSEAEVNRTLMQYGPTKGVVQDLVRRQLEVDEGIVVSSDSIVVTVGCQEGLFLVLKALAATPDDVVLAVSPTYVGLMGAARLVGCPVLPVRSGAAGVDLPDLVLQLRAARTQGLRPRALYLVPDVANPTGATVDLQTRHELLRIAVDEDLLLLEDNAYGVFAGEAALPSLKALDTERRVVRVGSFAKSVVPGARVGYVVADQCVRSGPAEGQQRPFADHLASLKSMLTVNTSPVAQAVVGGALLEHGCSLVAANTREASVYRANLAHVLDGLTRRFPRGAAAGAGVEWNIPSGGFFVSLSLPFRVDDALLQRSAEEYRVLWTPMSHFYADAEGGVRAMRLSFSQVSRADIDQGLDRLALLVRDTRGS